MARHCAVVKWMMMMMILKMMVMLLLVMVRVMMVVVVVVRMMMVRMMAKITLISSLPNQLFLQMSAWLTQLHHSELFPNATSLEKPSLNALSLPVLLLIWLFLTAHDISQH